MDAQPTELFGSYEHDFQHILRGVQDKLDGKDKRGEERKAVLRRVELDLDEAEEMVSQMEIEIQGIPQSVRAQYVVRLKSAKSELARYKKASKDAHSQASRTDLLGNGGGRMGRGAASSDDPYGHANSDRNRLLVGHETLGDGSRRLEESQRIALETESEGADILRTLRGQREQIENARDTLRGADTSIDRASGTLKQMMLTKSRQRILFGAIFTFFLVLIAIVLWFKLVR